MSRASAGGGASDPGPDSTADSNSWADESTLVKYCSIREPVQAQLEVKRSRFVAQVAPVADEVAARQVVQAARTGFWDARHPCSAFVLGPRGQIRRGSDDGEPSGTAGTPMLDVLIGHELTQVVAVVTRWFGGTLLGTGGLIRAYSGAVAAALADADVVTYRRCARLGVHIGVEHAGRVEHGLRAANTRVLGCEYAGASAIIQVQVHIGAQEQFAATVAALSAGAARIEALGYGWVPD